MIFNWDIKDVCIVFESWHIETWVGMVVSCAVIFAIAAGYEYLSAWTTTLDRNLARRDGKRHASPSTSEPNEHDALLSASR
jgi:copper transporter 1